MLIVIYDRKQENTQRLGGREQVERYPPIRKRGCMADLLIDLWIMEIKGRMVGRMVSG